MENSGLVWQYELEAFAEQYTCSKYGDCVRRLRSFQERFEIARRSGEWLRAAYFQKASCACKGISSYPCAPAVSAPISAFSLIFKLRNF